MSIRRRSERAPRRAIAALALVLALTPTRARADGDPLDAYRDTFRRGMERYKAGAVAEAIPYWENVYRELGPAKGYRVAYNLARAYDALGDSTRAAERYEAFLAEQAIRASKGAPEEPVVLAEAEASRARVAELVATKARVRVAPARSGERPLVAKLDNVEVRAGDVTYVAPGIHVVTFGAEQGHEPLEHRVLEAHEGELLEVAPPAPLAEPAVGPPTPPPAEATPRAKAPASDGAATVVKRPFSPVVLYLAGGVTLAGGVVTAIAYGSAISQHTAYASDATPASERASVASSYPAARTLAYASLGATIGLATVTGSLVTYYFLGGGRQAAVVPTATLGPTGASIGAVGRF